MPPRRIRLSAYATEGAAWTQKRSFGEPRISRLAKRLAGRSGSVRRSSLRRGGQRGADRGERRVGLGAERGDGANADHDDQGQHDRVLDCRRAVFTFHEINDEIGELTHMSSPEKKSDTGPRKSRPLLRRGGQRGADRGERRVGLG